MKALDLLEEELFELENNDIPLHSYIPTRISNLREAIAELEALQNRSCDNCKHWELGWCFKLGSSLNIGGCGDYWESR